MLKKNACASVMMCVIAFWSASVDAQMNGHNALGDFGVLSGSQPVPGFYAAGLYFGYDSDQVLDRNGNPLSLPSAGDPTTIGVKALVGLFWWVTDYKILGANYSIVVAPSVTNLRLEAPALGRSLRTTWGLGDLYASRDVDGEPFDARSNYVLHVPANVPVDQFWSLTAYDAQTAVFFENVANTDISSLSETIEYNDDGSIDLYVGPKSPEGKESNWIETNSDHNSLFLFRFYGPQQGARDGSWTMDGFRKQ